MQAYVEWTRRLHEAGRAVPGRGGSPFGDCTRRPAGAPPAHDAIRAFLDLDPVEEDAFLAPTPSEGPVEALRRSGRQPEPRARVPDRGRVPPAALVACYSSRGGPACPCGSTCSGAGTAARSRPGTVTAWRRAGRSSSWSPRSTPPSRRRLAAPGTHPTRPGEARPDVLGAARVPRVPATLAPVRTARASPAPSRSSTPSGCAPGDRSVTIRPCRSPTPTWGVVAGAGSSAPSSLSEPRPRPLVPRPARADEWAAVQRRAVTNHVPRAGPGDPAPGVLVASVAQEVLLRPAGEQPIA